MPVVKISEANVFEDTVVYLKMALNERVIDEMKIRNVYTILTEFESVVKKVNAKGVVSIVGFPTGSED